MPLSRGGIVAVAGFLLVSAVVFPPAADPFQAPRALLVLVAASLGLLLSRRAPVGRFGRIASVLVAGAAGMFLVSALVNGAASSVWGVHGRLQGLVAGAAFALAGVVGYKLIGRHLARIAPLIGVSLLVVAAVSLVQVGLGDEPTGTFGNPVLMGNWLAVAVAVAVAAAVRTQGRVRWVLLAVAASGALVAGLAVSRGGWIGMAVGVSVAVFAAPGNRRLKLATPTLALLLAAGILFAGPVAARKLSPVNLESGSAAFRLAIWDGTADLIADNPLTGVGPGRYLYEYPRYQTVEHARLEVGDVRPDQAHSIPLQIAAEGGVVAAALCLGVFGLALWAALRGLRTGESGSLIAAAGLAAFGGQALFGISTIETDSLAWLLGGAALAIVDARAGAGDDDTDDVTHRPRGPVLTVLAVAAIVLAAGATLYLVNDVRDGAGRERFAAAEFQGAWEAYDSAVRGNPLVDTYRLDLSDATAFLSVSGEEAHLVDTLAALDAGLRLEPVSHDLMLARARLLAEGGAPGVRVLDAYERAIEAYPLGVGARTEAARAAASIGEWDIATELARGVLDVAPEDVSALGILEAAPQ